MTGLFLISQILLVLNRGHSERVFGWVHVLRFLGFFLNTRFLFFHRRAQRFAMAGCIRLSHFAPEHRIAVSWAIVGRGCVHLGAIGIQILIVERDHIGGLEARMVSSLLALHDSLLAHLFFKMLPAKRLEVTHARHLFFFRRRWRARCWRG